MKKFLRVISFYKDEFYFVLVTFIYVSVFASCAGYANQNEINSYQYPKTISTIDVEITEIHHILV